MLAPPSRRWRPPPPAPPRTDPGVTRAPPPRTSCGGRHRRGAVAVGQAGDVVGAAGVGEAGRPRCSGRGTTPCPIRGPRRSCARRRRPIRARRRPTTAPTSRHRPPGGPGRERQGRARPAPPRRSPPSPAALGQLQRRRNRPRCSTIPSNPASDTSRLEPRPMTKIGSRGSRARPGRRARRTTSRSVGAVDLDVERGRAADAVGRQRAERLLQRGPVARARRPGRAARRSASPLR